MGGDVYGIGIGGLIWKSWGCIRIRLVLTTYFLASRPGR